MTVQRSRSPLREPAVQLVLDSWPCPTCLGEGRMLGPNGLTKCRVCQGEGRVPYDPHDHTVIPY